jgi:uncharacterized protein (DUF608 family)
VLTLVLSWYFPHHVWDGEFATDYGNYYTNFWSSAKEVALGAAKNKTESLQNAINYHRYVRPREEFHACGVAVSH